MSESAEEVAQAFVQSINRQDVDASASLMTDEHRFVDSLGNVVVGRESMRAGWAGYFRMVPDYTIAVEEIFSEGAVVVLLGIAQGTYAPDSDLRAENRWTTPAAIRAEIDGDRVAEWRVYADNEPIRQRMTRK